MKLRNFTLAFILMLVSNITFAGGGGSILPSINTSTNDNRVYAGLKWSLSGGIKPEAVLGFRHANINSSGDTDGGDISISAKFMDGFQPGQYELNTLMVKKTCKVKWAVVMTSHKVSLVHWACMPLIQILG